MDMIAKDGYDVPSSLDSTRSPTRAEAEQAVRTLIRWAGDDPNREGLLDTPKRVVKAYEEFFAGYAMDPDEHLMRTFNEVEGYDELVLLRGVGFESHCEHHMVPVVGVAHIAYLPDRRVVGLSKLARVLDAFAKRMQTQEAMTAQLAATIDRTLRPRGVAVMLDARHMCMTMRGIRRQGVSCVTTRFTGEFAADKDLESRFLSLVRCG